MKLSQQIRFSVLAGVDHAHLEGEEVVGHWADNLKRLDTGGPNSLAVRFANEGDSPEDILRFTKKYGPLSLQPTQLKGLSEFRFSLHEWRFDQWSFRSNWESLVQAEKEPLVIHGWGYVDTRRVVRSWNLDRGGLTYQVPCLREFLHLELFSGPRERLRKCPNPDCKTPYFVAENLKQHCCSDFCKRWAQRQAKRLWWGDHGESWRKSRHDATVSKRGKKGGRPPKRKNGGKK